MFCCSRIFLFSYIPGHLFFYSPVLLYSCSSFLMCFCSPICLFSFWPSSVLLFSYIPVLLFFFILSVYLFSQSLELLFFWFLLFPISNYSCSSGVLYSYTSVLLFLFYFVLCCLFSYLFSSSPIFLLLSCISVLPFFYSPLLICSCSSVHVYSIPFFPSVFLFFCFSPSSSPCRC